jgi:hypothetical protein
MFQGAPLISDFDKPFFDDWQFPIKPVLSNNPDSSNTDSSTG